jgi:hypothetical protein
MKQPHKHAECIKAWADGAEIEYRRDPIEVWKTADCPQWSLYTEYRIKSQPVIVKKYTYYDRIEKYVNMGIDLNEMTPQVWYDGASPTMGGMLEWTFTDGKLTSVTMIGTK